MLRIADSAAFRNAPPLRDFLLFVTERALAGKPHEISELSLGEHVFQRRENYDTTNDNIVRVSARQVRIKLKEYAENDGRTDAWSLEIPKGAYVPVFTRRLELPSEPASTLASPLPAPAEARPDRTRFWQFTSLVTTLLALGFAAAFLGNSPAPTTAPPRSAPLSELVIRHGQRTLIVLADSSLVLLHELTGQTVSVDDYAARRYPESSVLSNFGSQNLARRLTSTQLTSLADLGFAMGLIRLRPDAAERIQVVHARNVSPRSLKENNVILLGGPRSNPWAVLYEDRLNFRFDFAAGQPSARIRNSAPQPGEPAAYETEGREGNLTRAFARVALVPNLNQTGRVLLISGTTIEAIEAASEFFLNENSLQSLTVILGRPPSDGKGFEILLEVSAIGGTARNASLLAHRLLH